MLVLLLGCPTARVTGIWRDETRSRNGKSQSHEKCSFGGENPAVRVHAVCATRSLEIVPQGTKDERQGHWTLTTEWPCKWKSYSPGGGVKAPSPGVRLVNAGLKREGRAVSRKPMRRPVEQVIMDNMGEGAVEASSCTTCQSGWQASPKGTVFRPCRTLENGNHSNGHRRPVPVRVKAPS